MDIFEFAKNFNQTVSDDLKLKLVKKHIKRIYCPVSEKIDVLRIIKDYTSSDTCINLVDNKIYFTVSILYLYTDLNIDIKCKNKNIIYKIYDELRNNNIIGYFMSFIKDDIEELLDFNEIIIDE